MTRRVGSLKETEIDPSRDPKAVCTDLDDLGRAAPEWGAVGQALDETCVL